MYPRHNPVTRLGTPRTSAEIINRLNEITFNSALISELRAMDFVNRLIDGDLTEAGMAFAREMTGYSLPVLNLARDAIRRAPDLPLHEGLKIEADLSTLAFQTADSVEGMTAFIEKRKAVFKDG